MNKRGETRQRRRRRWMLLLIDLILFIPLFSCYSITYFVNMNDDGSGHDEFRFHRNPPNLFPAFPMKTSHAAEAFR